ncbi:MAG TPA: hypothetical protein DCK95_04520 [Anaerolineaceae bacterium]|uniref:HD/PDEase domain-containing protein n=1 Tax=Anaerolinea thermophila TaxID=167964 RepID=A0A124FN00_9CHLR|nr:MAG: hypothetical protein XD73_0769 [Anaerolinea thermophila]HAF61571.1 hypothetical protein [Anaerolineaceae bacterium]
MKTHRILDLQTVHELYPYPDPVHGFDHIERVYKLCQVIGKAEGADADVLLTAALLHDCDGSDPTSQNRCEHHLLSAQRAGSILHEMDWIDEDIQKVQHCIRAHRFRKSEVPQTIEAMCLFDADKLDVIGAIGIARTIGYAVQAGEPIYCKPSSQFIETGVLSEGEHHSVYHEYLFKLRKVQDTLYTETGRKLAHGRNAFLETFFNQLINEVDGRR